MAWNACNVVPSLDFRVAIAKSAQHHDADSEEMKTAEKMALRLVLAIGLVAGLAFAQNNNIPGTLTGNPTRLAKRSIC